MCRVSVDIVVRNLRKRRFYRRNFVLPEGHSEISYMGACEYGVYLVSRTGRAVVTVDGRLLEDTLEGFGPLRLVSRCTCSPP
ncbi:CUN047 hypothetical protein [Culex nigripalpus nucleopolyhedrovirus]|uniref:Uncharacterized protein n=2 Tax=Deltabaculovirus TaxID=558019 RepID=Q77GU4_NPVCO|nr:CUN047 hypothetical protein [Culex nigripalpus nucleopolyhedrovirus]AAK13274.1 unknown [Culex nigripalpus nucleopolyhedrovirus]AAK94125.1 CUN047 hypothetical protein [Culex nigripalpus nucleopolyhedrovirus]